jgi:hypothetical protein
MKWILFFIAAACAVGCGSKSSSTSPSTTANSASSFPAGSLVLRASPIDQNAIRWITPLGNLNPPAHTTPTDHIYFYFAAPDAGESPVARRTDFMAPGDGTVTAILGGVNTESKVFVRQTSTFTYYLDHLILTAPITQGSKVTAGQLLGTSGTAYGIDLGVMNDAITLNFLGPSHYSADTIHADAPLKYFDEPLRSQLYARVQRIGPELDGKIDFDVAGRLSGNWFVGNTAAASFVYDTYDPSRVLISTGVGTLQGVFGIAPGDPLPRDVTTSSGKIRYQLTRAITGPPRSNVFTTDAYMLVEMTDDTHIRMQTFLPDTVPDDFTGGAGTFTR